MDASLEAMIDDLRGADGPHLDYVLRCLRMLNEETPDPGRTWAVEPAAGTVLVGELAS